MAVEMAFGRLKGCWRCLLKRLDSRIQNVSTVIAACFVLYNFCDSNKDGIDLAEDNLEYTEREQKEKDEREKGSYCDGSSSSITQLANTTLIANIRHNVEYGGSNEDVKVYGGRKSKKSLVNNVVKISAKRTDASNEKYYRIVVNYNNSYESGPHNRVSEFKWSCHRWFYRVRSCPPPVTAESQ
ncbi:hypothetical protein GQR58_026703 [Nymphon striatum]|nr:hypothetical protein GQR58_026703 [Nymphon striatum]